MKKLLLMVLIDVAPIACAIFLKGTLEVRKPVWGKSLVAVAGCGGSAPKLKCAAAWGYRSAASPSEQFLYADKLLFR